ncbi:DNA recombination protein RmuC [Pleionea mediterranea]|uniref:DNA recombination protein RmuC n=1 Tax=Pleionea mediterranea TaxID=523701 RepID=A0A316FM95_9GAMM|nr:DNA recombination protein RmuC [Pleionea mediterranea]PWK49844.1 DNA recombination protein RmuC [Pleionea mediterranea]
MILADYHIQITLAALVLLFIVLVLLIVVFRQLKQLTTNELNRNQMEEKVSLQLSQLREFQVEKFSESNHQADKAAASTKEVLITAFNELKESIINQQNQFQSVISGKFEQNKQALADKLSDARFAQQSSLSEFKESLLNSLKKIDEQNKQAQLELRDKLIQELRQSIKDIRQELTQTLTQNSENLLKGINSLTQSTDERLKDISGQVEKRLSDGFEKTTQTFNDVLKRLALIDDAQKKITELSSNVVSLQQVLADKRSRGAFGEVQLNALIKNVLPENNFSIQHRLSNEKIADCILFLPDPTGNVVIDAKFPLESYQRMTDFETSDLDRVAASKQFKQDIKKHIKDIKSKYIIEGETAPGAMMFIPAEAVFAEIHGHFPELVELAHKEKVWMVSPTTMMAILTTASAVIKDEATRKQVHIIQEHLGYLSEDFGRFKVRMDNLSKHIGQVSKDVDQINTSAQKITSRFKKIERVDLPEEKAPELLNRE